MKSHFCHQLFQIMLPTKITDLFSAGAKIEDGIHPDRLKLALEVLETFLFEQPLIKSYHTLLDRSETVCPNQEGRGNGQMSSPDLQVMTQTGTTDVFIYIAYSNSTVGEKVQTQHMRTYFDELCEQKGWPEFILRIDTCSHTSSSFELAIWRKRDCSLCSAQKPTFSYNHNYGMEFSRQTQNGRTDSQRGYPEWSSVTLTDRIYQFWTGQEYQLYQALLPPGKNSRCRAE